MKKIYKLPGINIEYFLVSIIIILAVIASISQMILYAFKTPIGHSFLLVHNYIEDYYYYLHLMRQGWEGHWLATSWMTPEKFPGAFVNTWFLFLGHAAKIINISLPAMYLISRVAGAAFLLFLSYLFIIRMYSDSRMKRLIALLFVSFSTYWWGWANGHPTVAPLVHEWTELDPIFRTSFVPHHLWAKVFMLTAFFIVLTTNKITVKKLLFIAAITLAMGLTNPVVYVTYLPILVIWFISNVQTNNKRLWPLVVVSFAVAGAIGIYDHYLELHVFPWSSYLPWEQSVRYSVSFLAYIQSLGPTFPLFLVAFPWLWRKGSMGRFLIAWVAVGFLNIFMVSKFVPLSNSRYLGGYQFIPLAIGAVAGVWQFRQAQARVMILAFLLFYFSIGLFSSWKEHVGYVEQNKESIQVYVPNDLMDAFRFIEKNTPKSAVIAAPYEISTMIPALSGRRVIAGHPLMTYQAQEKRVLLDELLSNGISKKTQGLLHQFSVDYLLSLTGGRSDGKQIFQNTTFAVYLLK